MSLFTDASLVMIPSGIKDQKVYSVTPTDGSGDLTFSRASNATRVNSSGLVEKVRTNQLLYSQDFSDTTWVKERISVSSNVTTAPDGTSTADKIVENTDNNSHRARQNANSTQGLEYTLSCFLKASERTKARVLAGGLNASADFDLSTGVIIGSPTLCTASITNVGSGWYRCAITYTQTSVTLAAQLHLIATLNAAGDFLYTGDGTSGIFVWGAMLETGVATDYIATTTTAVSVGPVSGLPRLDYSGGASCPSLLLEPQRSNLVTFSESFNNAAWSLSRTSAFGSGSVVNAVASPDGYTNAEYIQQATGQTEAGGCFQSFSYTSGTTYTLSAFAKQGENRYARLGFGIGSGGAAIFCGFDLQDGIVGTPDTGITAKIENYGNGWYRCSITATSQVTLSRGTFVYQSSNLNSTTTTPLQGIYVYGAQLEVGAYATSYIPTLSSAVTRVADAASKTGISSLIGQTEGTLFVEVENTLEDSTFIAQMDDGGANNRIIITTDLGTEAQFYVITAGSTEAYVIGGTLPYKGRVKFALAYKANDFAFYANGQQIGTDNSGSVPAMSVLRLGENSAGSGAKGANYKQTLLFKTRLSNADLATLTTL